MLSHQFQLSESDQKLAKNSQKAQIKAKYNEKSKKKMEKKQLERAFKNEPELYDVTDESKIDPKYKRKSHEISKMDQSKFAVLAKNSNREELVRKVKWISESQKRAQIGLTKTDLMRTSTLEGGIELEDDVFSSTSEIQQHDLVKNVDLNTQRKIFDIQLSSRTGPFSMKYTASGRHVLVTGSKGLAVVMDWKRFDKVSEIEPKDRIRDSCWLMDNSMYALANDRSTSVYNVNGVEYHMCHDFKGVRWLDYMPYHFLLCGATSTDGTVLFKDISLGKNVGVVNIGLATSSMTKNPYNSLIVLGHLNGTVSMVTPRDPPKKPVISMLCHHTAVNHMTVDSSGKYLVSCSTNRSLRVWDIRNTYKYLVDIEMDQDARDLKMSQKGALAIAFPHQVSVWGKFEDLVTEPYMKVDLPSQATANSLDFCPYEDILGIGHTQGVTSALIPGSGEPNFDSRAPNPFSTVKQISDWNVRSLLEKIPGDMISLDPSVIGTTGDRIQDYQYSKDVKLDAKFKEKLDGLGIVVQKDEKLTEQEQYEKVERAENKLKQKKIGKDWWNKEGTTALDRFATGKIQKDKVVKKEVDSDDEQKPKKKKKGEKKEEKKPSVDSDEEGHSAFYNPFVKNK